MGGTLDLGWNQVENISQLANMASLETLYLDDLKNIDLSTLPPLKNLKHLACYCSYRKIRGNKILYLYQ